MAKKKDEAKADIRQRARELLGELDEAEEKFKEAYLFEKLTAECADKKDELLADAVRSIVKEITDEYSKPLKTTGPLEQRELWDREGGYRLGDGELIPKRAARRPHTIVSFELGEANRRAVNESQLHKKVEIDLLEPYHSEGVKKKDAIAAFEADHPDMTYQKAREEWLKKNGGLPS